MIPKILDEWTNLTPNVTFQVISEPIYSYISIIF